MITLSKYGFIKEVIKKYFTSLEVYLDFAHFRDKKYINILYFPMDFNAVFIIALIIFTIQLISMGRDHIYHSSMTVCLAFISDHDMIIF